MTKESKTLNRLLIFGGLFILLLIGFLFLFRNISHEEILKEKKLMVYVGSCMMNPIKVIVGEFSRSHPEVDITVVAKGSGMLMNNIRDWERGDIFMPGEESYAKEAIDLGYMDSYTPIANHKLTVIIQKGNPKGIASIEDITDDSIRVVAGGKKIAMGRMFIETIGPSPNYNKILDNHMYAEETKCTRISKSVASNLTDVGITCLASSLRVAGVDHIDIKELSDHPFIIPVGILKFTNEREAAQQFIDLVTSEFGKGIMEQHGFPPI